MVVKTKGAAPASFYSGKFPIICLFKIPLFMWHTMHLLATVLASLFPPGMKTVRHTLAVTSLTVIQWSSVWAA